MSIAAEMKAALATLCHEVQDAVPLQPRDVLEWSRRKSERGMGEEGLVRGYRVLPALAVFDYACERLLEPGAGEPWTTLLEAHGVGRVLRAELVGGWNLGAFPRFSLYTASLLGRAARAAGGSLQLDPERAWELFLQDQQLLTATEPEVAKVECSCRLIGVESTVQEISLGQGARLRVLDDEEILERLNPFTWLVENHEEAALAPYRTEFRCMIPIQRTSEWTNADTLQVESTMRSRVAEITGALALASDCPVYPGPIRLELPLPYYSKEAFYKPLRLDEHLEIVDKYPDLQWMPSLSAADLQEELDLVRGAWQGSSPPGDPVLVAALMRFAQSMQRPHLADRIVDLATAWESLTRPEGGKKSGITRRLADGARLYADRTGLMPPDEAERMMRRFYEIRGDLVHGNKVESQRLDELPDDAMAVTQEATDLFRSAFRWLAAQPYGERPYRSIGASGSKN